MLDVARHFFAVAEVKRYIDLIALYKINRLHLHLSDDQGWRIEIDGVAAARDATAAAPQVGGGPGGYYTQARVRGPRRATPRARYITIVPEIDMPGHTNAALASYAELNCDGVAPPLYTGIEVGFSSLCVGKDDHVRLRRRRDRRARRADARPVLPHRRRRGAQRRRRADYVHVHRARAARSSRSHGKRDDRLGRDRRGPTLHRPTGRAVLATRRPALAPSAAVAQGAKVDHVAGRRRRTST